MRITVLSSCLVLGALAGSAHADRGELGYRYHARAALAEPAHAMRAETARLTREPPAPAIAPSPIRSALAAAPAPLSTGDLAFSGPVPARRAPFLSATEISHGVAPHAADIEHCYLDQLGAARHGGSLEVTLVIGRDGGLVSLHAAATGASPTATHKIEACLHGALDDVRFPERRNDTTTVVPYAFHKTDAPGAGPILSCWSAKGCPAR
jgi:hypothetical protein